MGRELGRGGGSYGGVEGGRVREGEGERKEKEREKGGKWGTEVESGQARAPLPVAWQQHAACDGTLDFHSMSPHLSLDPVPTPVS